MRSRWACTAWWGRRSRSPLACPPCPSRSSGASTRPGRHAARHPRARGAAHLQAGRVLRPRRARRRSPVHRLAVGLRVPEETAARRASGSRSRFNLLHPPGVAHRAFGPTTGSQVVTSARSVARNQGARMPRLRRVRAPPAPFRQGPNSRHASGARNAIRILVVTLAAALPLSAFAAGGHDGTAAPAATPFTQRRGAHLRGGAEQGGAEPAHQVRLHGLDRAVPRPPRGVPLEGRPGQRRSPAT